MTRPNSTEIIFIIDRSGSMQSIAADMIGGFAAFIAEQRKTPGDCRVTLTQFDDHYDVVYAGKPLDQVDTLSLEPRGGTALLDAIGRTVSDTGNRLRNMKEGDRPSQVLVVIITDGGENASREYKLKQVFDMITLQRERYHWEFVFLGANQDSIATAAGLGIHTSNAVLYAANGVGTEALMRGLSSNVADYRMNGQGNMENLYNQKLYDEALNQQPTAQPTVPNKSTP